MFKNVIIEDRMNIQFEDKLSKKSPENGNQNNNNKIGILKVQAAYEITRRK